MRQIKGRFLVIFLSLKIKKQPFLKLASIYYGNGKALYCMCVQISNWCQYVCMGPSISEVRVLERQEWHTGAQYCSCRDGQRQHAAERAVSIKEATPHPLEGACAREFSKYT